MKSIKETEMLVNLAKALGQEVDENTLKQAHKIISLKREVMESVRSNIMKDLAKASKAPAPVIEKKVEPIAAPIFPIPPSLDDLESLLGEQEPVELPTPVATSVEYPVPPSLDEISHLIDDEEIVKELVEEIEAAKEETLAEISAKFIKEANKDSFQQPEVEEVPKDLNKIIQKLKYLEQWLGKVSMAGPGGGETKLRFLDDVDRDTIKHDHYLRYNIVSNKFDFYPLANLVSNVTTDLANVISATHEPIGHEERTDSNISFNNATRTFTITPANTLYKVWVEGVRYDISEARTVTVPNTTGLYYIYYSNTGTLAYQTDFFDWPHQAPTAYVYWNADNQTAPFVADERHGVTLDWQTHEYLHRTRGAAIANGFNVGNYVLNGNGSSNTHMQLDIASGTFFDEDLQVDIVSTNTPVANTWEQDLAGPARIPMFYLSGNAWKIDSPTDFPIKKGTVLPQYNSYNGSSWTTTDIDNNKFGVTFIIATNNINYPVIGIIGQSSHANQGDAEALQFSDLTLTGFPVVEMRPLYKVVYGCKTSYTNYPKSRIVSLWDLRSFTSIVQAAATTADHGLLTGLSDDDHPQYLHIDNDRTSNANIIFTGNISFTKSVVIDGDFTVNGNTTTLNTATLSVEDKNIVLANGVASASASDGAGISVSGSYANLTYFSTPNRFNFNKYVDILGNTILTNANTTSHITEGTNLYFTNARTIQAFTAGNGIILSSNGLIQAIATGRGDVVSVNGANGNVDLFISSNTLPSNATIGTLWHKPYAGNLYLYVPIGGSNIWIEIDQAGDDASVQSVNGQGGNVVLTTANIVEQGNLYFTNSRVVSALTGGNGISIDANGLITGAAQYGDTDAYANVILIGFASNTYVNNRLLTKANAADLNTSNVVEGSNLYFTNTRAVSAFTPGVGVEIAANGLISSTALGGVTSVNGANGNVVLTTANIAEGSNLYYTNARVYANVIELGYATNSYVNTRLSTKANVADLTTANVAELTNLYFTNSRVLSYLQVVGGNILPSVDVSYNLGSPSRRWKDLYLSGSTVYLGEALIEASNSSIVLPAGSEITGQTTANIAEGGANLYYSNDRVSANVATLGYSPNAYVNTRLLTKANVSDLATANIIELTNLYFTNARVYANVIELGYATNSYVNTRLLTKANTSDLTTANVSELTNLYYTNTRVYDNVITLGYSTNAYVNTRLLTKANVADLTTNNVIEGANLYFTNTRAVFALTAGSGISIAANGRITSTATGGGGISSLDRSFNFPGELSVQTGTARWYPQYSYTLNTIRARVSNAPNGNDINLNIRKNGNVVATTSILDGLDRSSINTSIPVAYEDYITVDITSVGNTAKGTDLVVSILYSG